MQDKNDMQTLILSTCALWGAFLGDPFRSFFDTCPPKLERTKHKKLSKTSGFEHMSRLGCFLGGPFWNFSGGGKKEPLGAKALKTHVL